MRFFDRLDRKMSFNDNLQRTNTADKNPAKTENCGSALNDRPVNCSCVHTNLGSLGQTFFEKEKLEKV